MRASGTSSFVFDMNIRLYPTFLGAITCLVSLLLVLWSTGNVAQAHGPNQDLPYDEEEAQSIDKMLICPVCPAETIDQAQVELSKQMRRIVREMLAQGADRDEILDFFVVRYGTEVLAAPPKSGTNLVAWLLPVIGVLAALAVVFAIMRSMASRGGAETVTEPAIGDDLGPYLEAVDREMALSEDRDVRVGHDSAAPEDSVTNDGGEAPSNPISSDMEMLREDEPKRNG